MTLSWECTHKKTAHQERETNLWRGGRYRTTISPCWHGQVGRPCAYYDKAGIAPALEHSCQAPLFPAPSVIRSVLAEVEAVDRRLVTILFGRSGLLCLHS